MSRAGTAYSAGMPLPVRAHGGEHAARDLAVNIVGDGLRARAERELVEFGERLGRDDALRARLDGWASDFAVFAVERYGSEVTSVITQTIERWDGHEAARKIELHVGRDLQFIRINGTVVGALAGIGIHTIAQLAG